MSQPLFLAENFFSVQQFRSHVVSGIDEKAGNEAFRVGTARRSPLNQYANNDTATNLDLRLVCDRIRSADCLILDRNGDYAGRRFEFLAYQTEDFSGLPQLIFETTVADPMTADVVLGSSVNDQVREIRTDEGVYIIKFPEVASIAWRLIDYATIDSPRFGGVYLGKSFTPTHGGRLPFDDEEMWTDFGVVRRGVPDNDIRHGRTGAFGMMMASESEWNEARRPFRELFGKGFPMWIVPDSDKAERTWLGYNAPGSVGAAFSERPQGRTVVIRADEYDARLPL